MSIPTVVGITGRSIDILRKVFKGLLSTEPWLRDGDVLPIPFREGRAARPEKLTLGIFKEDGIVRPHPPITRAIKMITDAMEANGHDVSLDVSPFPAKLSNV
jgi:amidase